MPTNHSLFNNLHQGQKYHILNTECKCTNIIVTKALLLFLGEKWWLEFYISSTYEKIFASIHEIWTSNDMSRIDHQSFIIFFIYNSIKYYTINLQNIYKYIIYYIRTMFVYYFY